MKWCSFLLLGVVAVTSSWRTEAASTNSNVTQATLWEWREDVRDMFYHAFDAYMNHGFPWDELQPLTCKPRKWFLRERGTLDDTLGGYMLTLVDALDMLAVVGDYEEFSKAVSYISQHLSFDRNVTISTFEANIRVLGGLLSAHLLASKPQYNIMPTYDGSLLLLAADLGERLLPAFDTPTGLPYHRVNLIGGMQGVKKETVSCTAATGTFATEFHILSKLTGDNRFQKKAKHAMDVIWKKKSPIGLLGNSVDVHRGTWMQSHTGIGAGVDSYLEYTLKYYILSGDPEYWYRFQNLSEAVHTHMDFADLHTEVHLHKGRKQPHSPYVSSLQAFWPGIQVLAGNVALARRSFARLWSIWKKYEALPEIFDVNSQRPVHFAKDAPLRPELIESLYHLYSATGDMTYVEYAHQIASAIDRHCRVDCGYASIADVTTKRLDDRMDSYFFSETLKYLWLIFDLALRHSSGSDRTTNQPVDAWTNWTSKTSSASAIFPGMHSGYVITSSYQNQQENKMSREKCSPEDCKSGRPINTNNCDTLETTDLVSLNRGGRGVIAGLPVDESRVVWSTEGHFFHLEKYWEDSTGEIFAGVCPTEAEFSELKSNKSANSPIVGSIEYNSSIRIFEKELRHLENESVGTLVRLVKQAIAEAKASASPSSSANNSEVASNQLFLATLVRKPGTTSWHHTGGIVSGSIEIGSFLSAISNKDTPFQKMGIEGIVLQCRAEANNCAIGMAPSSNNRVHIRAEILDGDENRPPFVLPSLGRGASFGPILTRRGLKNLPIAFASPLDACTFDVSTRIRMLGNTNMPESVIAVAIRGGCSFQNKVANLNRMRHVAGVLIINDPSASHMDTSMMGMDNEAEVSIPSALLSVEDPGYRQLLQLLQLKNIPRNWCDSVLEDMDCCFRKHTLDPPSLRLSMSDANLGDGRPIRADTLYNVTDWPQEPPFSSWPLKTGQKLRDFLLRALRNEQVDWKQWWEEVFNSTEGKVVASNRTVTGG